MIKKLSYIAFSIALITNSLAEEPPPEIYEQTDAPITIAPDKPYDLNSTVYRPISIQQADTGFKVNNTASINGNISSWLDLPGTHIFKQGLGQLELNGANTFNGRLILYQGSLSLGHNQAVGNTANNIEIATGSTLILKPNISIDNNIAIQSIENINIPIGLEPNPALVPNGLPVNIQVDQSTATLNGMINSEFQTINKTGLGTLRLNGLGVAFAPLNLQQGGLEMNGVWINQINADMNTVLSGTGIINGANIAGELRPGTSDNIGQITIHELNLADSATTTIRIGASNDSIISDTYSKLNGSLNIQLDESNPNIKGKYTIVSSHDLDNSRFTSVYSPKAYLDPIVEYQDTQICNISEQCQNVVLKLAFNNLGLNYANPNWLASNIMDIRFIRDTAIAHTDGLKPWARTWFANSQWHNTDRDTSGIQIGHSISIGQNSQIALFAGGQYSHWRQGGNIKNQAIYAGLGYSQNIGPIKIKLGHAISQNKGHIKRHATDDSITSKPKATINQTWLHLSPNTGIDINPNWQILPYMEITHIHSKMPSYTESGSLSAVHGKQHTDKRILSTIGLNLNSQWDTKHGPAQFTSNIGISNNWGNKHIKTKQSYLRDSQTFTVPSLSMPKTSLRLDLGIKAPIAKNAIVELAYTGEHSKQQKQHGIWGGMQVRF